MKTLRYLLMAVAALGLFAGAAQAQDYIGKFNLPIETQWGKAVLPAGNYTLEHNSMRRPDLVTVRGEKETIMTLPASQSFQADRSQKSALVLARMKGKTVVRTLVLAELGMEFYYPWPKGERIRIAEGPVLIQRVPITRVGR